MIVQGIRRIIGGAHHPDIEFFQQSMSGKIPFGEFFVGYLPDFVGGIGA